LIRQAAVGFPENKIKPLELGENAEITDIRPFQYIYAAYDKEPKVQHLFKNRLSMS